MNLTTLPPDVLSHISEYPWECDKVSINMVPCGVNLDARKKDVLDGVIAYDNVKYMLYFLNVC